MDTSVDIEKVKKQLRRIFELTDRYNIPELPLERFEYEDFVDIQLALMEDESGDYVLKQNDRKILLQAITGRYIGVAPAEENMKKLETDLAKNIFKGVLERHKKGFKTDEAGISSRMLFFK